MSTLFPIASFFFLLSILVFKFFFSTFPLGLELFHCFILYQFLNFLSYFLFFSPSLIILGLFFSFFKTVICYFVWTAVIAFSFSGSLLTNLLEISVTPCSVRFPEVSQRINLNEFCSSACSHQVPQAHRINLANFWHL